TQTGSQAEEEHLGTLVAPQSLHGRIIDDLDWAPKRCSIVKPDPTRGEVMRFGNRPAVQDRPRVADRHCVILPFPGQLLDPTDHLLGRQLRPRWELATFLLPGGEDLHMRSAHIDDQHVHGVSLGSLFPQAAPPGADASWLSPGPRSWRRSPS